MNVIITVKKIDGECPVYKVGDKIVLDGFFIDVKKSDNVCLHAFTGLSSFLIAFSHGVSAKDLGIGDSENLGTLQCPDPGPPETKGGTVYFEIRRFFIKK